MMLILPIHEHGTSHQQQQRQKSHDHINRCGKSSREDTAPISDKNTQQSGNKGSIPQQNKGHI